jgi:predicted DNA-binding transcriptional regulator AlpA
VLQNPEQNICFDELPESSFVRLNQLLAMQIVPFSAATTWRRVRAGTFPRPVKISHGVTAWRVGDVREWQKKPSDLVAGGSGI